MSIWGQKAGWSVSSGYASSELFSVQNWVSFSLWMNNFKENRRNYKWKNRNNFLPWRNKSRNLCRVWLVYLLWLKLSKECVRLENSISEERWIYIFMWIDKAISIEIYNPYVLTYTYLKYISLEDLYICNFNTCVPVWNYGDKCLYAYTCPCVYIFSCFCIPELIWDQTQTF